MNTHIAIFYHMQITAFILLSMGIENYVFASSTAAPQVPRAALVCLSKGLTCRTAAVTGTAAYLCSSTTRCLYSPGFCRDHPGKLNEDVLRPSLLHLSNLC